MSIQIYIYVCGEAGHDRTSDLSQLKQTHSSAALSQVLIMWYHFTGGEAFKTGRGNKDISSLAADFASDPHTFLCVVVRLRPRQHAKESFNFPERERNEDNEEEEVVVVPAAAAAAAAWSNSGSQF